MKSLFNPTATCLTAAQIDGYLAQQSSRAEQRAVEAHLIDCPLCSDAVDGYVHLQASGSPTTAQSIAEMDLQELEQRSNRPSRPIIRLLAFKNVAATLLVLIVSVVAVQVYLAQSSGLHEQYYSSIANIQYAGTRSIETSPLKKGPLYKKGMDLYDQGNYAASIPVLEKRLAQYEEDGESRFFLAMALMETQQFSRAKTHLEIARINEGDYYQPATYNLALAQLKLGEIVQAKRLLEELAQQESPNPSTYEQKAHQLLKEDLKSY